MDGMALTHLESGYFVTTLVKKVCQRDEVRARAGLGRRHRRAGYRGVTVGVAERT